jgi:putative colanic acid biosynthesis acetyltransferase WcaF
MNTKNVRLDTFNNAWFSTGRPAVVRGLWYLINALFFINPLMPLSGIKVMLLRLFGAKVGAGVIIKPGVNIKYPWLLSLGNYVWIGENVWIDNLTQVAIADHVCISQGALLLTGNHNYKMSTFDLMVGKIVLEEGVWIGARSVVCPGVHCRSHAILTVGSTATADLDAFTIYQGNPAVKVRVRKME